MARKTVRAKIPANPDERLKLLKKVLAKHEADGTSSPLNALAMDVLEAKTEEADSAHQEADRLYKLAEIETKKRDAAFGTAQNPDTAVFILSQARAILLGINKANPQALQNWGFEVVEGSASTNKPKNQS